MEVGYSLEDHMIILLEKFKYVLINANGQKNMKHGIRFHVEKQIPNKIYIIFLYEKKQVHIFYIKCY